MRISRKSYLVVLLAALMVVLLAACGGGAQAEREREIYETAIDEMMENIGLPPMFAEQDDNDGGEQTAVDIDLGLPIVVQNTTFIRDVPFPNHFRINIRITEDAQLKIARLNGEWEMIDTDVRSVTHIPGAPGHNAIFYIKNDNSLWALGSNTNGLLGDGTGMDRDEPVHILDNVAQVYTYLGMAMHVLALQIDGTLLHWGVGVFEPTHLGDNIVNILPGGGTLGTIHTNTGLFYTFVENRLAHPHANFRIPEPAYDRVHHIFINDRVESRVFINHARTLIIVDEEIADNVERLFEAAGGLFFIKSDGSLWGIGANNAGQLGDGTRVPRNEPVHIADDVMEAGRYQFLTANGILYTWDENNPTPQPTHDNVAALGDGFVHLRDGSVLIDGQIIENVRIPDTITFD